MARQRKTQQVVVRDYTVRQVVGTPDETIPGPQETMKALAAQLDGAYEIVRVETRINRVPVPGIEQVT